MTTSIFTSEFYNRVVLDGLKNAIVDNPTYVFVADPASTVTDPADANSSISFTQETLNSIVFGKKVTEDDVVEMITRRQWVSNTVYTMYDNANPQLESSNFFVLNSARSVYKCLDNNDGLPSTVEPTSLDPIPVTLADGYTWLYLYRLTVSQLLNQATEDLIPVHPDANTTANAINGTVDSVVVTTEGSDYLSHSGVVSQVVSNTVFRIENSASAIDGSYINSAFYISSGPGIGSLSRIAGYSSNSQGRFVTVEDQLSTVTISSSYSIAPQVVINGNGSGATAVAMIDTGVLTDVMMLETGEGYTTASVSITANSAYGSGATARAITSPVGGHGSHVAAELFAKHLLITVDIDGNESESIPNTTKFSRYGLIGNVRDAANTDELFDEDTFNNTVVADTVQLNGTFSAGDTITSDTDPEVTATVVYATANSVCAIYGQYNEFEVNDGLVNQNGVAATVANIVSEPNISLAVADVYSITNINTATHTANTQETINIILRV